MSERRSEALALIDSWLELTSGRQLISASEVADLLLDLRQLYKEVPMSDTSAVGA